MAGELDSMFLDRHAMADVTLPSEPAEPLPDPPPARTLGEKRVGIRFNPSGSLAVDIIKREGADLIDLISELGGPVNSQFGRWKAEALTCIETGIMYAVKAATAGMEPEDG